MLLWFVSALLLAFDFPDIELRDLEIDASGTIWLLPESESVVIRLEEDGQRSRFETGFAGLPAGLAVSPTGRWIVSYQNPGVIHIFDQTDILSEEIILSNPGDVMFSGLTVWTIDTLKNYVITSNNEIVARNCCNSNSRLCLQRTGTGISSGPYGVFLLEWGERGAKIADSGSACFSDDGILILSGGTLFIHGGDTLLTDLPYSRISASPEGETVVLWGNAIPLVIE